MTATDEDIARLNDAFRTSMGMSPMHPGVVLISEGVAALGPTTVADIMLKIARYDFLEERNPSEYRRLGFIHGPHDLVAWRIFCFESEQRRLETDGSGANDFRVMEIGLASEVCG